MRAKKAKLLRKRTNFHPHETDRTLKAHEYPRKIRLPDRMGGFIELDAIKKTYYNVPGTPRVLYQNKKKM